LISFGREDLTRLLNCSESTVVLSAQDEGLYGSVQGAGQLCGAAQFEENLARHFVILDSGAVSARDIERIAHRPEALRHCSVAPQPVCQPYSESSHHYGLAGVNLSLFPDQIRKPRDNFSVQQFRMLN
jgi:hypothetical protein